MVTRYSFRLATALLGLLVIIFPFLGLPATFKNILLVIFGSLIILFSLAEADPRAGRIPADPVRDPVSDGADNREGQSEHQTDSR